MADATDAIGGYFELELRSGTSPHAKAMLLNSGRACFEYVLRCTGPRQVHLPKYTCSAMFSVLERLSIPYVPYGIDERLEIESDMALGPSELLVYTNYLGLKDEYCTALAERFGEALVLDCAQALCFAPPGGAHTFYSPRKFLGVPDGGCLYTQLRLDTALDVDSSVERIAHLVQRIDFGPEQGYPSYQQAEALIDEAPMRRMSRLTQRMLSSVDVDDIRRERIRNYGLLHDLLGSRNRLSFADKPGHCPLAYPFAGSPELRRRLIASRIFVPSYWPNVAETCGEQEFEHWLATHLLPLPVDQRYGEADMRRIAEAIG